jgi:hypothetical protein
MNVLDENIPEDQRQLLLSAGTQNQPGGENEKQPF